MGVPHVRTVDVENVQELRTAIKQALADIDAGRVRSELHTLKKREISFGVMDIHVTCWAGKGRATYFEEKRYTIWCYGYTCNISLSLSLVVF